MKNILLKLFLLLVLAYVPYISSAQTIPFSGKARILVNDGNELTIELVKAKSDYIKTVNINANTVLKGKSGNPITAAELKPGTEVKVQGKYANYVNELSSLEVTNNWAGETIKVEGLLEKYDPGLKAAYVDGYRVILQAGGRIKGSGKLRKSKMSSLADITPGNLLKFEGKRREDGMLVTSSIIVSQNDFDEYDQKLIGQLDQEFSAKKLTNVDIPLELKGYAPSNMEHLPKGYVNFGDAQFKLSEDLKVQAYVNYVGNKVVPQWQRNIPYKSKERLRFRFYVIDNPTFNAYALPNGMIFVHTGLLNQLDNEAQLAAVLGHEIAHATYEHAKQRYEKKVKNQKRMDFGKKIIKSGIQVLDQTGNLEQITVSEEILSAALLSADLLRKFKKLPPETQKAFTSMLTGVKGIASNEHNKEHENQADRVGLFYMEQAGYDPREGAAVWRKLMDETNKPGYKEEMFNLAQSWLTEGDRFSNGNPLKSAGDVMVGFLANKMMDNWFSSHPKAKVRYRNLNHIVLTTYGDKDFSAVVKDTEDFQEVKQLVR